MTQIIHASNLPDVEIPELSITELVLGRADELADRVAITDGGEQSYTFGELRDRVRALAGGLAAEGFGPGSTLGLMAPNMPDYAVVFHGVATAGATITTINPTYGADEVRFQLNDAGASKLITVPMFLDTALAAVEGTDVTQVVVIGGQADAARGIVALDDLMGDPIDQVPVDLADHVVVLPYSSGTTGLPKGVMLTHRNLVANIAQTDHVLKYDDDEAAFAALPFFHIYGMQVLMNGALAKGVKVVTMPRFDLEHALRLCQEQKITRFFAVPPMVLALAKSPVVDQYDLSTVKQIFSGAAPLGAELGQEAADRLGCEVVQGYGMTELSPISHSTVDGEGRPGTSGVAVSNVECRLVSPETGEDVGIDTRGELWVRSPGVMKGYLNNPEATAATIDADGWLHTGDIAVLDEHGHYAIVDRIKELIKVKGFQVAPAELEALIVTHPAVADVAVIGVPDDEAGELPKAFVTLTPGAELTLDELRTFLADHVVKYKLPGYLDVIEAIPKSASGKILRRELRS